MKYFDYIKSELDQIDQSFDKNELAYLALTSKVELPIRDKLAFNLYKKFWPEEIVVMREWLRTDLILLKDNIPIIICELKAGYTFDSIYNHINYQSLIPKDINKSKNNLHITQRARTPQAIQSGSPSSPRQSSQIRVK